MRLIITRAGASMVALVLVVVLLLAGGVSAQPGAANLPATGAGAVGHEGFLQPSDRVLFVGDGLTQQMFYCRAVATGLLAMRPEEGLRFYNGGYAGSGPGEAAGWIDDLLGLARPTVVFVCFGLDYASERREVGVDAKAFSEQLAGLLDRLAAEESVRRIVVLGPPAVDPVSEAGLKDSGMDNAVLAELAKAARKVSEDKNLLFINLYAPMLAVYSDPELVPGEQLSYDGKLPSEVGHVVIASVILAGIGVEAGQLQQIGWSPLRLVEMGRVGNALALQIEPAGFQAADLSRALYQAIGRFDERFFRAWRIAGRRPTPQPRRKALVDAEADWSAVRALLAYYRGR